MRFAASFLFATLAVTTGCAGLESAGGLDAGGGTFTQSCSDSIDDVYTLPGDLPAFDDSHRGDVIRCATDVVVSADALNAAVTGNGYTGSTLPSGVSVFRIAYRTTRLKGQKGPGDGASSALVFMPDTIASPNVLVVTAHGTVGLGDACAPSVTSQTLPGDDTHTLNLALAGHGWITIAPDYAGFGYGGEPQGWSLSEDEAHSVLDATRAMANLLPAANAPKKVVLVGHSQGGHAVLSAQSLAASYGNAGELVGVVGFAPLWVAPRAWGAAINPAAASLINPGIVAFDLLYFYGHGELYDGPGGGVAMFQAAKQSAVRDLVSKQCLDGLIAAEPTLGATPADYFDPKFVNAVGNCGLIGSGATCETGEGKVWNTRFSADRPKSNADGADILVWAGGKDTTIPPGLAQCGIDKITRDFAAAKNRTAKATFCGDPDATHGSVVERDMDWVNQWIAARAAGGAEPAKCAATPTIACQTPPTNAD